jgi:hypothetical protein
MLLESIARVQNRQIREFVGETVHRFAIVFSPLKFGLIDGLRQQSRAMPCTWAIESSYYKYDKMGTRAMDTRQNH